MTCGPFCKDATHIRIDNTAKNCKLHKFATTNSILDKNQIFQICDIIKRTCISIFSKIGLVDQSKHAHQCICKKIAICINLQLPLVIFFKSIISDTHHRKRYMYINFQQNRISRSVKTVNAKLFANNRNLHKFCNL